MEFFIKKNATMGTATLWKMLMLPISLATINKIKNKTCGKKIKETYILNYEN
jgi:hypothetical protein